MSVCLFQVTVNICPLPSNITYFRGCATKKDKKTLHNYANNFAVFAKNLT